MPITLTPKRKHILDYIADFRNRNGFSPTLQEIGDHFGINKVTVYEHVDNLISLGLLSRQHNLSRSLIPTRRATSTCPHCGGDLTKGEVCTY